MNSRERLLATLRGQQPDRIAWEMLIDGYFLSSLPDEWQHEHFGCAFEEETAQPDSQFENASTTIGRRAVQFSRWAGADVFALHAPGLVERVDDLAIEETIEGSRILRTWRTGAGILTDVIHRVPESPAYPFYGSEYRIKTTEDMAVYRYIWEHTHYELDAGAYLEEDAYIGNDGIAVIDAPQSAVQFLLGEAAGMVNFYHLLQDHPAEMDTLIAVMHAKIREAYECLARSPALVVIAMEDLSSTTSSPAIFERYSWRHLNEYADILHGAGKIFLAHMCGRLKAMAPLIARSRLDGVESLTAPPLGDLSIAEARRAWGKDFLLVGGLNAAIMIEPDQQVVRAAVLDALHQASPGLRFILSNADAVPFGARLDTIQTITETVQEHGAYPLLER